MLRVADVPYTIGPSDERRDVGSRVLPSAIADDIATQLLRPELQVALEDVGEIEYDLPEMREVPGHRFTIVAGIDRSLRVEIHRRLCEEALTLPSAASPWLAG